MERWVMESGMTYLYVVFFFYNECAEYVKIFLNIISQDPNM